MCAAVTVSDLYWYWPPTAAAARSSSSLTKNRRGLGYTLKRNAHAGSVVTAKGRRVGRPVLADPDKIAYAVHLREQGATIAQIVAKTGVARTSLYRHMPPRPPEPLTADGGQGQQRGVAG